MEERTKKTRHHQSARVKAIVAFCVCCGANPREREKASSFFTLQKKKIGCLFRVFGLLGFRKMSKENKNFEEEKRSLF